MGEGWRERSTSLQVPLNEISTLLKNISSTRMLRHISAEALESQIILHKVFSWQ